MDLFLSRFVFRSHAQIFFLLGILAGTSGNVVAANLQLPTAPYPYSVVEQEIGVVLREFGQNMGIRVNVSPKVEGIVRGKLPTMTPREFLDRLCEAYALNWYFDGSVLYISTVAQQSMRFLSLGKNTIADLQNAMTRLSFTDERYTIKAGPDGKSAVVSGPPRFIALAEQTIASLSRGDETPRIDSLSTITVFRGSQTSAVKFGPDDRPAE